MLLLKYVDDSIVPALFSIIPKFFWNNFRAASAWYQNSQNHSRIIPPSLLAFLDGTTTLLFTTCNSSLEIETKKVATMAICIDWTAVAFDKYTINNTKCF